MLIIFCAEIEEAVNIKCPKAKIVITGPGLCNVIQTPQIKVKPGDKLINVGYAGSNKYPIGSVVSASSCKRFIPSQTVNEPTLNLVPCYNSDLCYTADDFVENEKIDEIPLIDMELYYLASIYPQIESLKIVSDNLNFTEYQCADTQGSWDLVNRILNNL